MSKTRVLSTTEFPRECFSSVLLSAASAMSSAERRVTFLINGNPLVSSATLSFTSSLPQEPTTSAQPQVSERLEEMRRRRRTRKKEPLCWRTMPPISGYRRAIIDCLNGIVFLLSIIMFYAAMSSLAHMDIEDLKIDPFMYLAVLASLVSLFISILGCQTPRLRRPARLTSYLIVMVLTTMCFLASAIEIAKFREALEHLVINDITYFNHSPESTAHDYLIRYRTGFMTLWKDGSCTGGGCSTPDCTEDPLHFQAVYCPMDTNFQAYVETLLESADTDSTDDTVMECRNRLIAEGEEPLHPQDAVPVADPYGNVNSWCRIRDTLIESPLTSITMCVWTASLLAGMQMLAVTAVSIVELTDRLKLSDLFKKPRTMTELTNGNRQQARSDAVVDQV